MVAQSGVSGELSGLPVLLASLSLVLLSLGLSGLLRLGIGRQVAIAAFRAAAQLLVVGVVFAAAFASSAADVLAWCWVALMVLVATAVVSRRAEHAIGGLRLVTVVVVSGAAAVSLGVVFGFGVIDYDPVSLVVVAGITIGNAVPSAVVGVNESMRLCRDRSVESEGGQRLQLAR
ncbi:MAG: ABC transporter permease, partial [Actinomycetota bacterium]